jgi:short-subunit dehydrogenase
VDVLVNNTGFFAPGQIHSEAEGVLENMINTNLYSAYHLTRSLINDMIALQEGYIFNICSTASIMPYVNGGSYCISKYALYGMTKVLREEMKEHNIRVTAILPGPTLTASWDGVNLPPDRFIKSEDIAEAIFGAFSLSNQSVIEEIVIRPQLGDL